ncbi:hypothetical protein BDR04DRAFT_1110922, partial [Suillus decipiens]
MRFSPVLIATVVLTAAISADAKKCPAFCAHRSHCKHCDYSQNCVAFMCASNWYI